MNKRDVFIDRVLSEAEGDEEQTEVVSIYFDDLTTKGREKILQALDNSDELLDVFGDEETTQKIKSYFSGVDSEGNETPKPPIFTLRGSDIRRDMKI